MGVARRLTEMQRRFAELVIFGGPDGPVSGTEAAKIAGYSEKRARQEASELQNPRLSPLVVQHIGKLREEKLKKYEVTYSGHVAELARIKDAAKKRKSFRLASMTKFHVEKQLVYTLNVKLLKQAN